MPAIRDELTDVYADSHAELLDQSFYHIDRYWERVESYLRGPGFDLVTGRLHGVTGEGYGRQLHDALLADRPEERATLLVRQDNPARDLYLRWAWRVVGIVQPFPTRRSWTP